ncbi:endonuclease/exonuclease/phosphatase family protein [Saccharothrix sp. BKS2]|uniref:endonuclease/exonuclease/phosphatase family protein n=1 Tax=Saccharothrix sp. BKS2 TaxID=3064400 RepID=UPI0039ECBFB6
MSKTCPTPDRPLRGRLSSDKAEYSIDEVVELTYSTTFPSEKNWVALYRHPDKGPTDQGKSPAPSLWKYAPGNSGVVAFWDHDLLAEGTYLAYFLHDNGYAWLAPPILFTIGTTAVRGVEFLAPRFSLRNARAGVGYSTTVSATAATPRLSPVTYALARGSEWVELSTDGEITGCPRDEHVGTTVLEVTASDGEGTATAEVSITVRAREAHLVDELVVATWNQWYGGREVNGHHAKELRFLLESGVDVVGIQESYGDGAVRLARALGWHHVQTSYDLGIVSKYPIVEEYRVCAGEPSASPDEDEAGKSGPNRPLAIGARIAVGGPHQRDVLLWTTHLWYTPYGPHLACHDGRTCEDILSGENRRRMEAEQIAMVLADRITRLDGTDDVVVMTGDYNAPSHLDWTGAASGAHCGYSVEWPSTRAMEAVGLRDTYREVHPDPIADPGVTWSPVKKRDEYDPRKKEPQDRIDFIHVAGRVTVVESITYVEGTPRPYIKDKRYHVDNEWTSDHAAVITRLAWLPR